jgi:non-heme chloroperoxidase
MQHHLSAQVSCLRHRQFIQENPMLPSTMVPPSTTPVDEDLAEQARPGHGIPSQDPDAAAQMALAPDEAAREANSALTGGGLLAGVAAGAAVGVLVAGPVGVVVGAALGAVSGALGGAAVGATGVGTAWGRVSRGGL